MGEAVLSPLRARGSDRAGLDRCDADTERAARRSLRRQIVRLEAEIGAAVVWSVAMRGHGEGARPNRQAGPGHAHVLSLGELELIRDELVGRLRAVNDANRDRAARQAVKRAELERMRLEPGRHRFTRITCEELGEPGCGAWQVRPRLGLVGMLAGWWELTLSSGCPLPASRR